MAEFKVVIDGADLPEDKRKAINDSIQRAVLPHLADIQTAERPVAMIPDRRLWRGIWIGPIEIGPEGPAFQFEQHFGGGVE
jgi:hypothetical protein